MGATAIRYEEIRVGQVRRRFGVAGEPLPGAALLVAFHGLGIDAATFARWTGLAERGPAAGFATVFPEGLAQVWDDTGRGRLDGADDAAFIATLIARTAVAPDRVVLAGLSNGAAFAEHLARHGLVEAAGVALVAGSARAASRRDRPLPARPCGFLAVAGTADPNLPYAGGPARGLTGWIARRRVRSQLADTAGREAVAPERVAADWAAVNGAAGPPAVERVAGTGEVRVERLCWPAASRPVELLRIEGGGHGWPGGPQYVPRLLIGRVAAADATGWVLDFARRVTS